MMASDPRVWAVSTNFGTLTGTNSSERQTGRLPAEELDMIVSGK